LAESNRQKEERVEDLSRRLEEKEKLLLSAADAAAALRSELSVAKTDLVSLSVSPSLCLSDLFLTDSGHLEEREGELRERGCQASSRAAVAGRESSQSTEGALRCDASVLFLSLIIIPFLLSLSALLRRIERAVSWILSIRESWKSSRRELCRDSNIRNIWSSPKRSRPRQTSECCVL
jgi:hypothetical protein